MTKRKLTTQRSKHVIIIKVILLIQGVVTFIRPVEPSATGIKIFDGQIDRLIAIRKGP